MLLGKELELNIPTIGPHPDYESFQELILSTDIKSLSGGNESKVSEFCRYYSLHGNSSLIYKNLNLFESTVDRALYAGRYAEGLSIEDIDSKNISEVEYFCYWFNPGVDKYINNLKDLFYDKRKTFLAITALMSKKNSHAFHITGLFIHDLFTTYLKKTFQDFSFEDRYYIILLFYWNRFDKIFNVNELNMINSEFKDYKYAIKVREKVQKTHTSN